MDGLTLTIEHLNKVIKEKHITRWTPYSCPVCDYPIHFVIQSLESVRFDGGCNCSDIETLREKYTRSSLKEIILVFNSLSGEDKNNAIKFWSL